MSGPAVVTIKFEDHFQDFLEWDLDAHGNVVESRPFQGWLWCEARVTNMPALREGAFVKYRMEGSEPWSRAEHTIRYPLTSVQRLREPAALEARA